MSPKRPDPTYLRTMRLHRNLTLKELADLAAVSMGYLSELERDSGKKPSPDVLKKISDALDLSDKEREELLDSFGVITDGLRAAAFVDGRWIMTWAGKLLAEKLNETKYFEFDYNALLDIVAERL